MYGQSVSTVLASATPVHTLSFLSYPLYHTVLPLPLHNTPTQYTHLIYDHEHPHLTHVHRHNLYQRPGSTSASCLPVAFWIASGQAL